MRMRTAGWRSWTGGAVPSRPSSRGAFRVTAVAVVLVAAGVTAGSAPAATQQSDSLTLRYSCAFPSGSQLVSAQITAVFPTSAKAGQPIKPTGTKVAVTLTHTAVSDLAGPESPTVALTVDLGTVVSEATTRRDSPWQDFTSPAEVIRPNGPLTFTAHGAAPQINGATPGQMTVTATGLELLFTTTAARGATASPPGHPVVCVPAPDQDRTLTSISVTPAASNSGQSLRRTAQATPNYCPQFPKGLKLNPVLPLPTPPPGSRKAHTPQNGCSYATGFTDAQKLHEAALVGPGLTDLVLGIKTFSKFPPTSPYTYIQIRAAGQFNYHGLPELPSARATLLAFGFAPVSATLQISEIGSLNAALISCAPTNKCPNHPANEAVFLGLVTLRIYNVDVNGVPLNVGSHCQTATPFELDLVGLPPSYNVSTVSGVLTGTVTIPSFSGCANGPDNLDPIFDATVSGPGNFVKITQAAPCFTANPTPTTCPPRKPTPKH